MLRAIYVKETKLNWLNVDMQYENLAF